MPSIQLPIMPTPLPLLPLGIGMNATLSLTFVTAGSRTAVLISPGQPGRLLRLGVRENFVIARGCVRREVLAIHEHLDVADDRDAKQLLGLGFLARRNGSTWRRPGPNVPHDVSDVRIAADAESAEI